MPNLPLCHWSSQLFDLHAPSSTDVPLLLLNQPNLLLYDCTTIVGAWNRLLPGPGLTAPSGEKNDDDDNDDDDDDNDDDDDDDDDDKDDDIEHDDDECDTG